MPESKEEPVKQKGSNVKIEFILILIVLLILSIAMCVVVLIREAGLRREIEKLQAEMAAYRLESSDAGSRLEGDGRLVNLTLLEIDDDWEHFYDEPVVVAEWENLENVVWEFSDSGERAKHKVYLTFDDGPSTYTNDILDILDSYGVKATFFVIGKDDEESLALYERIYDEGHTLGMHSYSHVYSSIYESESAFLEDFNQLDALLENVTGQKPMFYRFPGGSSNTVSHIDMHVYIDCLNRMGVTYFDWNVSSGDASGNGVSVDSIVENSLIGIEDRDTSVILLHDTATKKTTVEALPMIIESILAMEDTEILPITSDTTLIQHVQ